MNGFGFKLETKLCVNIIDDVDFVNMLIYVKCIDMGCTGIPVSKYIIVYNLLTFAYLQYWEKIIVKNRLTIKTINRNNDC